MTLVVLAGVGFGCGLLGMGRAVLRPRRKLGAAIGAVESNGTFGTYGAMATSSARTRRIDHVLGMRLAAGLHDRTSGGVVAGMLASTGMGLDQLCAEAALGGIAGVALPIVCWVLASIANVRVPIVVPVWGVLVLGAGGTILPFAVLRSESVRRRRLARRVIGCFLDLVVLCLAAGMGVEGALHSASQIGQDVLSRRLAATLERARDSAFPPWSALVPTWR